MPNADSVKLVITRHSGMAVLDMTAIESGKPVVSVTKSLNRAEAVRAVNLICACAALPNPWQD